MKQWMILTALGLALVGVVVLTLLLLRARQDADEQTTALSEHVALLDEAQEALGALREEHLVATSQLAETTYALEQTEAVAKDMGDRLSASQEQNDVLQHANVGLSERVEDLDGQRERLETDLARSEGEAQALTQTVAMLETDLQSRTEAHDAALAENAALAQERAQLAEQNQQLASDAESSEEARAVAEERLADQRGLYVKLTKDYSEIKAENKDIIKTNEGLVETNGQLERANASIAQTNREVIAEQRRLATEINRLERRYRSVWQENRRLNRGRHVPVAPGAYDAGVTCTGSMYPNVKCTDEFVAIWDFDPQAIEVGSVILFTNRRDLERTTIHRVIDRKVEDGVHYFLTKGDANRSDDGYWIPETEVAGYMVGVKRGARPQFAELEARVHAARENYYSSLDAYREARDQHCKRDDSAMGFNCDNATEEERVVVVQAWEAKEDAWCIRDQAWHAARTKFEPDTPYQAPERCEGIG